MQQCSLYRVHKVHARTDGRKDGQTLGRNHSSVTISPPQRVAHANLICSLFLSLQGYRCSIQAYTWTTGALSSTQGRGHVLLWWHLDPQRSCSLWNCFAQPNTTCAAPVVAHLHFARAKYPPVLLQLWNRKYSDSLQQAEATILVPTSYLWRLQVKQCERVHSWCKEKVYE